MVKLQARVDEVKSAALIAVQVLSKMQRIEVPYHCTSVVTGTPSFGTSCQRW